MKNKVKDLVVIEINTIVKEIGAEKTVEILKEHGILFWNSLNTPNVIEPKLIPSETFGKYENVKVIDVTKPEQFNGHKHILENEEQSNIL